MGVALGIAVGGDAVARAQLIEVGRRLQEGHDIWVGVGAERGTVAENDAVVADVDRTEEVTGKNAVSHRLVEIKITGVAALLNPSAGIILVDVDLLHEVFVILVGLKANDQGDALLAAVAAVEIANCGAADEDLVDVRAVAVGHKEVEGKIAVVLVALLIQCIGARGAHQLFAGIIPLVEIAVEEDVIPRSLAVEADALRGELLPVAFVCADAVAHADGGNLSVIDRQDPLFADSGRRPLTVEDPIAYQAVI